MDGGYSKLDWNFNVFNCGFTTFLEREKKKRMQQFCRVKLVVFCFILISVVIRNVLGADWPAWRGAAQNGASLETGLVSTWSQDGDNLVWKSDFIGRSTPIVLNKRVYVIARIGEEITEQERVACFDAMTGNFFGNIDLMSFTAQFLLAA